MAHYAETLLGGDIRRVCFSPDLEGDILTVKARTPWEIRAEMQIPPTHRTTWMRAQTLLIETRDEPVTLNSYFVNDLRNSENGLLVGGIEIVYLNRARVAILLEVMAVRNTHVARTYAVPVDSEDLSVYTLLQGRRQPLLPLRHQTIEWQGINVYCGNGRVLLTQPF